MVTTSDYYFYPLLKVSCLKKEQTCIFANRAGIRHLHQSYYTCNLSIGFQVTGCMINYSLIESKTNLS